MKVKIQINLYQLSRVTGKILKYMRTKETFGPLIDRNTMVFKKKEKGISIIFVIIQEKARC